MKIEQRTTKPPRPEEFDDYREYLRAMVAHLKEHHRGFSFRSFARKAGYASPSSLHDVMEGRTNLVPGSIEKFARGLGLDEKETETFRSLVLVQQGRNDTERNAHYQQLRKKRKRSQGREVLLQDDQYDAYSLWYAVALREMLPWPDFQEDPRWIARRLRPPIRPGQAKKALELLERLGLATRNGDGRLWPTDTKIKTSPTVASLAARSFHRDMLENAAQALDGLPQDKRNISSLTLSLTATQYEDICRRIAAFREEAGHQVEDTPREEGPRKVFWVGFQVIPLSALGREER